MMYFLFVLLLGAVLWFVGAYNHFVTLSKRAREAWADIDVQLKRRYDLIPNLVATVKGYATHESETFEKVTQARTRAMSAPTAHDKAAAENELSGTLKSLFALSEGYPELHANDSFLKLVEELSDTENKIQAARRFYNANVRDYSIAREKFPGNFVASVFGFQSLDYFELAAGSKERDNVAVKF